MSDDTYTIADLIAATPGCGLVMPIGGAEEREGKAEILHEFVRMAGDERAHIVVIPIASSTPEDSGCAYQKLFRELGAAEVEIFLAGDSQAADRDEALAMLERATGIFISGGDQARLHAVFSGTQAARTIQRRHEAGVIVAGTSAGAAFLSSNMIQSGESRATPIKGRTDITSGLGLLRNIVVDTHFGERGRTGRLLEVLAGNLHLIAIGCDEDTAALIDENLVMRVVGSGSVLVLDGTAVRSDYRTVADGTPIMTNGAELHVITAGYTFDLRARKFVPPLDVVWTQPGIA